jgi:signal transduction histidine kinase
VGEEVTGYLGLAFRDSDALSPMLNETVQALSLQASLALQTLRLSQEASRKAEEASLKAQETAILEERNRMAREIHDTLAQSFTGVATHLEAARALLPVESRAQVHIAQARDVAREGLQEARRSVRALRPRSLEGSDLCGALRKMVRDCAHSEPPHVALSIQGEPCSLPAAVEADLLRVAQEALINAVRHAQAQNITIELSFSAGQVLALVRDDGQGFDPSTSGSETRGFGLIGIQERLSRMGGTLELRSAPGEGTQLVAVVPCGETNEGGK